MASPQAKPNAAPPAIPVFPHLKTYPHRVKQNNNNNITSLSLHLLLLFCIVVLACHPEKVENHRPKVVCLREKGGHLEQEPIRILSPILLLSIRRIMYHRRLLRVRSILTLLKEVIHQEQQVDLGQVWGPMSKAGERTGWVEWVENQVQIMITFGEIEMM